MHKKIASFQLEKLTQKTSLLKKQVVFELKKNTTPRPVSVGKRPYKLFSKKTLRANPAPL